MDLGLDGKAAIVTGGRSGIGAAIALRLAREGCDVAIVDRLIDERARQVVQDIEAAGRSGLMIEADVSDFAAAGTSVQDVLAEFGRLDIMVCNAGINRDGKGRERRFAGLSPLAVRAFGVEDRTVAGMVVTRVCPRSGC